MEVEGSSMKEVGHGGGGQWRGGGVRGGDPGGAWWRRAATSRRRWGGGRDGEEEVGNRGGWLPLPYREGRWGCVATMEEMGRWMTTGDETKMGKKKR